VTGVTESSDFPTVTPFQTYQHSPNASGGTGFVAELSADGSKLLYSSWLGGSGAENGAAIAVDGMGSAYVTGVAYSSDFPTKNAFQSGADTSNGAGHAFVTKLQPNGSGLAWSTYLGGSAADQGIGITVDAAGSAYVLGRTASSNFPVVNAFQQPISGDHAFVTKFSPTGSTLVYSTRLGGTMGAELAWSTGDLIYNSPGGISVDSAGHAYVAGGTSLSDFPVTSNALQPRIGAGRFQTLSSRNSAPMARRWSIRLSSAGRASPALTVSRSSLPAIPT
jgi:hypothetical protein